MGEFQVTTSALRTARSTLQALADDTAPASTYTATYLDLTGGDNGILFAHIDNVNASVRQRLDDLYGGLQTVLAESGVELSAAARRYDETDAAAAQRSDAQIPLVAGVEEGEHFEDQSDVPDTVPEDRGDYEPPEDHDVPDDEDGMIMAPGPLGGVPGGSGTGAIV